MGETVERAQIIDQVRKLAAANDAHILDKTMKLLHDNCQGWNWVGIYLLAEGELILGPYEGKPTDHTRIQIGVGVCGSAVSANTNIIVDDVTKRDNYLACTLETRSEIVVLIRHEDRIVAQFDIDSDRLAAFTKEDEQMLEALAPLVSKRCAHEVDQLERTKA